MINKQNLWFLTLFSLILVLSIYYLTMPESVLEATRIINGSDETKVNISESEILTALRVESDEEVIGKMNNYESILLDENASIEEKNEAYEALKSLNLNKGLENELENMIKDDYNLKAFVKINDNNIKVVIASSDHDETLASEIMSKIQSKFDTRRYITVKFQS